VSLDEAWKEVEDVLPEGWRIGWLARDFQDYGDGVVGVGGDWTAWAWHPDETVFLMDRDRMGVEANGPTPAAALRALAARLTEAKPETPAPE
jgi:hypothetical protein